MRAHMRHALRILVGGVVVGVLLFALYIGLAVFGI